MERTRPNGGDREGPQQPDEAFAEHISAAIAEAREELQGIETALGHVQRQLASLQQRATLLRAFITEGSLLLGEEADFPGTGPGVRRLTACTYAQEVLAEVGRPMSVTEMTAYLHARGLMRGPWTREVLRTAMRLHPALFVRVAAGTYALTAWDAQRGGARGRLSTRPPGEQLHTPEPGASTHGGHA